MPIVIAISFESLVKIVVFAVNALLTFGLLVLLIAGLGWLGEKIGNIARKIGDSRRRLARKIDEFCVRIGIFYPPETDNTKPTSPPTDTDDRSNAK